MTQPALRLASCLALSTLGLAAPLLSAPLPAAPQDVAPALHDELVDGITWREVGPYRGGRSCAVAGIPQDRDTYYFGACRWWRLEDRRMPAASLAQRVSDGFFGGSIGSPSRCPSGIRTSIYVGGGEKTVRGNVSHGDGMWKSDRRGQDLVSTSV